MAPPKSKLSADFCRCIKNVRKTIKLRPGVKKTSAAKEAAAIAVCVKSVLQTKGRTLKKFRCGKKMTLKTQKPLKGGFLEGAPLSTIGVGLTQRDPSLDIRTPLKGGGLGGAPYQSTDPTASRIQPGSGLQAFYDNAVKAPVQL